ncbi:hypothetical protein VPNG_03319 [Cytospora leucostoma]|uniref:Uncharacterized protein n=1 Tax=Cytospora leucostoma TaxID=1230097 RepID=A0A423XFG1_9PEZI|nr:hypothetical protein VPNG_03319 [Cytospora leucostoma]
MGISRTLATAVLGFIAVSATTTILALDIVFAQRHLHPTLSTRVTAIISSVLEAAVLALVSWIMFASFRREARTITGLLFASGIVLCVIAAALTVATLICLFRGAAAGKMTTGYLAGGSTALAVSFVAQLLLLVVRFVIDRAQAESGPQSPNMKEVGRRMPTRVKTIPYSSISPSEPVTRDVSVDSKHPPMSSGSRLSAAETFSSVASSLTHAVRPISSRTRLLSNSHSLRSQHSDAFGHRDRHSGAESFDSWDTSSVDPQNRQTPPQRAFTQQLSMSESHIHPLFRSDSPDPPPLATPSTVIVAAPQAGQVISDRDSIRSLSRMRSDSLPAVASPLSRTGSFDTFGNQGSSISSEGGRSDMLGDAGRSLERPVRKTPSREGPSGPGLAALPGGVTW